MHDDPCYRTFDLLLCMEPGTGFINQLLFERSTPAWTEELSDELRRLRAIVDLAPVLISIKDRQSMVRLTNRMFEVLDGPAAADYVNRSVFEVFPRDTAEHLWKNDLAVFHTAQVTEAEEVVRHRDGTMHTYLTFKYPLQQPDGKVVEVCAISTDITARKFYEQQALEAVQKAEDANRTKSEFLAYISHEIRTPLTVIHGYAELIARKAEAEPDSIRPWISHVMRASRQIEMIIKDLLDFSKIEAGAVELENTKVDLRQLLLELKNNFVLKAQEKNLNFEVQLGADAPSYIITDALRFRQVLDNLVSNALKFTERGSVDVVVQPAQMDPARYLEIWVRDTGIGLSEEDQKKLFQPFVQADGSITRKYGGTGLGLVLAKRLAHLLGGDVQIYRSTPGIGTDMLFTIRYEAAEL
ncbi:MAG TPA: ATP-binding protein [Oligoflexus sp.]|uniref:sensor histidine kinase n=1 Tax=Oligoflexus sp. TaxID=1971216 RepID=UPI002D55A3B6|nr:ATP-binding protein [Oligoflexus sp.]HYX37866.1 ATP-binding protein [Oligoflexus sp.]